MPCSRGRGLRLAMKHSVIVARVALGRDACAQEQQSHSDSTNRSVRLHHKMLSAVPPQLILGQSTYGWEGARRILHLPLLRDSSRHLVLEEVWRRVPGK